MRTIWRLYLKINFALQTLLWRIYPSPNLKKGMALSKIFRLFDQGGAWDGFPEPLNQIENDSKRSMFIQFAIGMFWAESRFDEARNAARFWCSDTAKQVLAHPEESRAALELLRRTKFWYLGRKGGTLSGEEGFTAYAEAMKVGGRAVKNYRDAHLTSAMLEWSKLENDVGATRIAAKLDGKRNIVFPTIVEFNDLMAARLGLEMKKFDQMRAEAEKF